MIDPSFSVIVPVYKAECYLCKCIDSILNQTLNDFELILVDDGSPDSSGSICDEYAKKDSRVRVIHKSNRGVASARNVGLGAARGEYILFCDSDDHVAETFLEEMGRMMRQSDVALAICGIASFSPDGIKGRDTTDSAVEEGIYNLDSNLFWSLFSSRRIGSCYDKIYRSKIIKSEKLVFMEDMSFAEDTAFVLQYLSSVKAGSRIAVTNKPLYLYYTDEHDSLVHRLNPDMWQMYERIFCMLSKYLDTAENYGPHTAEFYRYVSSAIVFTTNSVFRYKNHISYRQFRSIIKPMLCSEQYNKAFAFQPDFWSHCKKLHYQALESGNAFLIWSYYMASKLRHRLNPKK